MPCVDPFTQGALEKLAEFFGTAIVGYVSAALRLSHRFANAEKKLTTATEKHIEGLTQRFEKLNEDLRRGLQLEVETIKEHVRGEIAHIRERLDDLQQMAKDLRDKSGDYTEEAELARFMDKVQEWISRTNKSIGRIEGMLGIASQAVTSRPPPLEVPRPVPRPPRNPILPPRRK
jgi:ABC-type transporter Mla subunit MlaD